MFMLFILGIVLAVVFFKLGVYAVLVGLFEALLKVLLLLTGGFLVVAVWKWLARHRFADPRRRTIDFRSGG